VKCRKPLGWPIVAVGSNKTPALPSQSYGTSIPAFRIRNFLHVRPPRLTAIAFSLAAIGVSGIALAAPTLPDAVPRLLGQKPTVVTIEDRAGDPRIEKLLTQPSDLWERIREGFRMPDLFDPHVRSYESWYVERPELFKAILGRARRYLHFIVEELDRRGMPTELALLPIVESGFDPRAMSPAQAAGLWQFIPGTATRFGLAQNERYDGRYDVVASTRAALDYLEFLNGMMKDWHLALASYNWGENAVTRAVERNRLRGAREEFSSLTMPEETRRYVPRLQAIKNLIADPARFGIDLGALPNEPYFQVLPNPRLGERGTMSSETAAKLAGLSPNEFAALNPSWNHPRVSGDLGSGLVLPIERVEQFETGFERWREAQERAAQREPAKPRPRAARR